MDILLTGGTGFLGRIIYDDLIKKDHQITTLGRSKSDIDCQLVHEIPNLKTHTFDLVIHSAGKAHSIPKTKEENREFFNVNLNATSNLLKGLEQMDETPKTLVYISSVSVYGLLNGILINENSPLNAQDPYGLSKIHAEEIIKLWCRKHEVVCTILRLPLIAGPNPPGNLNLMITGIKKGYYFNVAGGSTKKSVVLAEDIAKIIPKAATIGGVYNLTDGEHPSFKEISEVISDQLNRNVPVSIPYFLVKILAVAGDLIGTRFPINSEKLKKVRSNLTFDDSKARKLLGWDPTPVLKGFKIS